MAAPDKLVPQIWLCATLEVAFITHWMQHDIPRDWPAARPDLWRARLTAIRYHEHLRRLEQSVYKRRWDEQWKVGNCWTAGPTAALKRAEKIRGKLNVPRERFTHDPEGRFRQAGGA